MYSNEAFTATGRCLNIDDIEAVSTYIKTTYPNYGHEYSATNSYPSIYPDEKGSGNTEGYNLSEQDRYYDSYSRGMDFTGTWTYYTYNISSYVTTIYQNLIAPQSASTYWLASRCVGYESSDDVLSFRLFVVER